MDGLSGRLGALQFDRPDHDAALGWFLSCGAAGEAQRLAAALYFFWYTRGWFVTGLRWLRAALAAEAPVEPLVRLRAEVGLAQLAFIAGDYLASFAAIESALPAARLLGDDVVLARCLATAGYVWWFLDPERSAALFEEGLEAARRSGDGWTRSTGLAGLGWARYFAARFDAATGPLQDAIELTARSGRRQQFAMAVLGRAAVELWLGQLAAAEASAQQALGRAAGDRRCHLDQCGAGDPGRDRTYPRPAGYGRAARCRGHRGRRAGQFGHQRDARHRAPGPHSAGPRRTWRRPATSIRPCNSPAPSRCGRCLPGGSTRWASLLSWKAATATREAGTNRPPITRPSAVWRRMPPAPAIIWGGWHGCAATGHRRSTAATRRWLGNSKLAITWGWSKRWRPSVAC